MSGNSFLLNRSNGNLRVEITSRGQVCSIDNILTGETSGLDAVEFRIETYLETFVPDLNRLKP